MKIYQWGKGKHSHYSRFAVPCLSQRHRFSGWKMRDGYEQPVTDAAVNTLIIVLPRVVPSFLPALDWTGREAPYCMEWYHQPPDLYLCVGLFGTTMVWNKKIYVLSY